ncbi:cuticle collagen 2C-like [Serinus canaria]|uniref:cuticle collagen 2C-like n=1 Tax=Serinus canaria TaxID=9135 RepID=UPI0011AE5454|nr:cuticle collagen 2C-like [Serinus canaria]
MDAIGISHAGKSGSQPGACVQWWCACGTQASTHTYLHLHQDAVGHTPTQEAPCRSSTGSSQQDQRGTVNTSRPRAPPEGRVPEDELPPTRPCSRLPTGQLPALPQPEGALASLPPGSPELRAKVNGPPPQPVCGGTASRDRAAGASVCSQRLRFLGKTMEMMNELGAAAPGQRLVPGYRPAPGQRRAPVPVGPGGTKYGRGGAPGQRRDSAEPRDSAGACGLRDSAVPRDSAGHRDTALPRDSAGHRCL